MKAHLKYLSYVLHHKWFVFLACLMLDVPIWQALIHDWTKFTPREWFPYAKQFFNSDGTSRKVRDSSGAYDPNAQLAPFQYAWLSHQRNLHHWQAWISIGNGGDLKPLPIPEIYVREMVADWIGAGHARGKSDPRGWYDKNRDDLVLHDESRALIEDILLLVE